MTDDVRCPVCGEGMLRDIAFDLATGREAEQQPESRELDTYTCGHRVAGAPLSSADADQLSVERRTSEETVDPPGDAPT